jgi:hypothetical protein
MKIDIFLRNHINDPRDAPASDNVPYVSAPYIKSTESSVKVNVDDIPKIGDKINIDHPKYGNMNVEVIGKRGVKWKTI